MTKSVRLHTWTILHTLSTLDEEVCAPSYTLHTFDHINWQSLSLFNHDKALHTMSTVIGEVCAPSYIKHIAHSERLEWTSLCAFGYWPSLAYTEHLEWTSLCAVIHQAPCVHWVPWMTMSVCLHPSRTFCALSTLNGKVCAPSQIKHLAYTEDLDWALRQPANSRWSCFYNLFIFYIV